MIIIIPQLVINLCAWFRFPNRIRLLGNLAFRHFQTFKVILDVLTMNRLDLPYNDARQINDHRRWLSIPDPDSYTIYELTGAPFSWEQNIILIKFLLTNRV